MAKGKQCYAVKFRDSNGKIKIANPKGTKEGLTKSMKELRRVEIKVRGKLSPQVKSMKIIRVKC